MHLEPRDESRFCWAASLAALLSFVTLQGLLRHLLWSGWAHSYDAMIYVRSLWGVTHGELFNPTVQLHTFSIHGNFVLLLLAPLARFFHPLDVLITAQALAGAATVYVAAITVRDVVHETRFSRAVRSAAPMLVAVLLIVGSPLILNPFLFDVRPDLLGVPLITTGLLRAFRHRRFDTRALLWMLAALLVREEYMMVIVGALVLVPTPRPLREDLKIRLWGVLIAVSYWAFYWFIFRRWIGDGSYEIAQDVGAAFLHDEGITRQEWFRYKGEILLIFGLSGGGLLLYGWRWMGATIPGLLLLLFTSRMQSLTLNFHYLQFIAPGVVLATVAGFKQWYRRPKATRFYLPTVGVVACIVFSFASSSALPGGGRYRYENFYLGPFGDRAALGALNDAHRLLSEIPDDVGLAAPHELAAPLANRSLIVPIGSYLEMLADQGPPEGIDWVVLPGNAWRTAGRSLVALHGFKLTGLSGRRLATLTREESAGPPWIIHTPATLPESCGRAAIGRWPEAGLTLCDLRLEDGFLRMTLARTGAAEHSPAERSAAPQTFVLADPATGASDTAWIAAGLVAPSQLPVGGVVGLVSEQRVQGPGIREIALIQEGRGPIPAASGGPEAGQQPGRSLSLRF